MREHIVVNPPVLDEKPVVQGTRMVAECILAMFAREVFTSQPRQEGKFHE